MKSLVVSILILVVSPTVLAQTIWSEKTFDNKFKATTIYFWSGVTVDYLSSRNKPEANPLIRNGKSQLNSKLFWGTTGLGYGLSVLFQKKHPKAANWLRIIGGSVHLTVGVRNLTKHASPPELSGTDLRW